MTSRYAVLREDILACGAMIQNNESAMKIRLLNDNLYTEVKQLVDDLFELLSEIVDEAQS